ncbi:hypothetical protein IGI04_002676 [Brassica rapa subsp. trilocularis]|uniref:Replication factor A C-terminal domain-containing protein n=1 Tax=Brassica rapa subsp. trilocularis TaxID=1813537 RepID=A0ABQ7NZJ6_BRACM|nr:hypothetical protein IGI04_002676 [Brassica rapa subsp. trilocularis]
MIRPFCFLTNTTCNNGSIPYFYYRFGSRSLFSGGSNTSSAALCSLECEAKEEELMGIDMLLLNEKGVLRFVGVIKSTFSDHEQSAQCIMVDLQDVTELAVFDAEMSKLTNVHAAEVGDIIGAGVGGPLEAEIPPFTKKLLSGDEPSNEMDGIPSNQTRHPIR